MARAYLNAFAKACAAAGGWYGLDLFAGTGLNWSTTRDSEINGSALIALEARLPADRDLVCCHPETGHVLDYSKMRKRFKDALAEADAREITFHELRHTFGTQMTAAGAPLRAIQEWMGRADAKTTEIYRHYVPDPSNGAAFVERAFGGGTNRPEPDW
jgi:integrase